MLRDVSGTNSWKEVQEISPKNSFRALRAAVWHFRHGGISQLRQWGSRKLGAEYAINYAKLLDRNQRQLAGDLDEFKTNYVDDRDELKKLHEQITASLRTDYETTLDKVKSNYEEEVVRTREFQELALASLEKAYQSKLEEFRSSHEERIGCLETAQHEAITSIESEYRTTVEDLKADNTSIAKDLEILSKENRRLKARVFSNASRTGLAPALELETNEVRPLVQDLIDLEHTLPLLSLARNGLALRTLNVTELRGLGRRLNAAGYWRLFANVQQQIVEKTNKDSDQQALSDTLATLAVFEHPIPLGIRQEISAYNPSGPLIHVAGKGLLDVQTGYTLRTAYTVRAQQQMGMRTLVALQPGSSAVEVPSIKRLWFGNIQYVRLPGKPRGRIHLTSWLSRFVDELETLVREEQPSVLHAHSDFLNAAAAVIVGRRNGVPVIYESRGFWEESWLSRLGDKLELGLEPAKALEPFGLPEAYTLRREAERTVRASADAVITLADVMKEHVEREHCQEDLGAVHIVPNAVAPDEFLPRSADHDLGATLGIPDGTLTIGYVTSMVEYEGIDILLHGFASLQKSDVNVHLLLVGDGPVLDSLKTLAKELGVAQSVTFTGQVPHDQVARYYSLIDIFVVPRRPTTVSQLVTPLKPFEAMSMAKTVVVSGVSALKEIATQSRAMYSFVPNDHADLARVLHDLVLDEHLRGELGQRARKWVEEHRSWEVNAEKTLEIYRSLGAKWPHVRGGSDMNWSAEISGHLSENPPPATGWFVLGPPKDSAPTIIAEGWQFEDHPRIRIDSQIEWSKFPATDRSLALWLQSWYFIDAFFVDERQPDLPETKFLVQAIRKWNEARLRTAVSSDDDESMTYYDMALALRVPRLLAVIALATRFEEMDHELDWLVTLLLHERQKLCEAEAFNPGTNHGFYTAAAQLHLEKFLPELPDHKIVHAQATERMNLLISSQFAEDGGHLEHSPSYHRILLEAFMSAVDQELIVDQEMVGRLRRAQKVMGWMIQPNGEILAMGDTEAAKTPPGSAMRDSYTEWIRTDGRAGQPEASEMLLLRKSGYVFVRSPQPAKPGERLYSSYLAFQGGFHSRAHKHADDLSFVWFDSGQEILIDAGRWGYGPLLPVESPLRAEGYYYSAPERQYVESVRAHNTIELDGEIHDRRRAPYGSAITDAKTVNRTFVISATAPHAGHIHQRTLTFQPAHEVMVRDQIESNSGVQRNATAWFLLNGTAELLNHNDQEVTFRLANGRILAIQSSDRIAAPVRGQEDPLIGWRSSKFEGLVPAWSIRVHKKFEKFVSIETRFRIRGEDLSLF